MDIPLVEKRGDFHLAEGMAVTEQEDTPQVRAVMQDNNKLLTGRRLLITMLCTNGLELSK